MEYHSRGQLLALVIALKPIRDQPVETAAGLELGAEESVLLATDRMTAKH
jgi:hypothetical protein